MSVRLTARWRSAAGPATSPTRPGWTRVTAPGAMSRCGRAVASSGHRCRSIRPRCCSRASGSSSRTARGIVGAVPPPGRGPRGPPTEESIAPADTFSHKRHRRLTCITCHTTSSPTRTLTFEQPRGCQICHHQRPATSGVHDLPRSVRAVGAARRPPSVLSVRGHPDRSRQAPFEHAKHTGLACIECHTTSVTLEPRPPVAACTACHADHHAAAPGLCRVPPQRRDHAGPCAADRRPPGVRPVPRPAHGGRASADALLLPRLP